MKKHFLYLLVLLALVNACQKEKSFEAGDNPSSGPLQTDGSGDCLPISVDGIYVVGTATAAGNTVTVEVNVTTGSYLVYTDTVNGFYFRATGTFSALGPNTVELKALGTPLSEGNNNFVVSFDGSTCNFSVPVLPVGGGNPAVFTLSGAPASCTNATVNGTYALGVALISTNTVTIDVDVSSIGTYTISSTYQGMTFSKSGGFATTGTQQVTLNGSGTPTTGGANLFPITAGTSTCNFVVNVSSPAEGTLSGAPGACTSSLVNGTYLTGIALVTANNVQVQITATTAGPYNITSDVVDGFSFAASGTAVLGPQLITLAGTGTPGSQGTKTFTVTFGTSSCTFTINVTNAAQAAFTLAGAPGACAPSTFSGLYMVNTPLVSTNILQVTVDVTTVGAYTISTNTVDGFSFTGTGTFSTSGTQTVNLVGTGTPANPGPQTFTVTAGASSCTATVTVVAVDYFPRTTNSNWSYEFYDNTLPADSILRKVIPQSLMAGGNTYSIFLADDGSGLGFDSSGYYRRAGGDYYEYLDIGYLIGFDPPAIWTEYIMLKDDVPVGTVWNSPAITGTVNFPPPTAFTIRFKYSIAQKDVPISITTSLGTTTYQNVIVVKEEYQQFDGVNWNDITTTVGYGMSYYARGVGLIKYEAFDPTGASVFLQELRRYVIY